MAPNVEFIVSSGKLNMKISAVVIFRTIEAKYILERLIRTETRKIGLYVTFVFTYS